MSADVTVFHSSEVDDQSLVPIEGWFVGPVTDEGVMFDASCAGPYAEKKYADEALSSGRWLKPSVPYPEFCPHPDRCAGKTYCQRDICCCD